jgi:hypoxanthine phosphoribosyltransferase
MKKVFLNEDQLISDSFKLATEIYKSGFRPTFIVGIWRGGSAVGIYVQECFQTLGVKTDHISVRTSYRGLPSYESMVNDPESIRVHGTQYLIENLNSDDSLLIVDDVFSSGYSIDATLKRLKKHLKKNMPENIKVATLYAREGYQKTDVKPDYSLHITKDWLVFPYELKGLSIEEIELNKPYVADLIMK